MKLIITRHGETEGNVNRILAGINDPLTAKGIEQAEKVAMRLKDEHIDMIYSSPIERALLTAKIIARQHSSSPVIIMDELKEIQLGSFEGKGFDAVDWEHRPNDVESKQQLYDRGVRAVMIAFSEHRNETVLFVAHNGINKAIIRYLRGLGSDHSAYFLLQNTSITIYNITENEKKEIMKKEILFNCTKHLE